MNNKIINSNNNNTINNTKTHSLLDRINLSNNQ